MSIRFSLCRLDKEGSASPLSTCSFDAGKRAIRIGRRTRENDVVLRDSENQVSNEHAIIEKCLHGYFVMDLNSTNGTFLDGRILKPNTLYKLDGQSRLMLPGYQLQDFEIVQEAEEEKPGQDGTPAAAWTFAEAGQPPAAGSGGEEAMAAAAYRQLCATASALMDEKIAFESEEEIREFCANIRIALISMITSFQNLDKGRLRVLEDFMALDAEAIQDSPLSGMESGQALQRLLDWRNKEEPGALLLDRSLQILIIHELALLKGYQEAAHRGSLRVLGKFEPAAVLAQARKKLEIGPFRIPAGVLPFAYRAAWKELEKKHAQLMDEDPQTFEALFRPEFAGTYEEITRKADEASQNLNQTQRFYVTNMEQMKRKTIKVKKP